MINQHYNSSIIIIIQKANYKIEIVTKEKFKIKYHLYIKCTKNIFITKAGNQQQCDHIRNSIPSAYII